MLHSTRLLVSSGQNAIFNLICTFLNIILLNVN